MDRIEYGKLTHSDHSTEWRDNQTLVLLTAGACLLALVIALKNILNIPTEQLTRNLILYVCILGGLATFLSSCYKAKGGMAIGHPGLWIAIIVSVTMAIIFMYALYPRDIPMQQIARLCQYSSCLQYHARKG